MKKLFILFIIFIAFQSNAQVPQGINYQAVIRNSNGTAVNNTSVGLRLRIIQSSATGSPIYAESFNVTTSNIGLINVVLGQGTVISGSFNAINWGAGPYFIEVASDVNGGTNYTIMGTQQMMSVPYALYAENSGTPGPQGQAGPSAYEVWLSQGNTGTESDFFNSLIGPQGNGVSTMGFSNDSLTINFTNGSDTTLYIGSGTNNNLTIGDYYQGGYVFYINPAGTGGLIVMPTDLMNYSNTSTWSDAINICNNVKCNGYTDWYLPTLVELQLIYDNLGNAGFREEYWSNSTATNVRWYWSSTPFNGTASYGMNFDNGSQAYYGNNNNLRIRGIRSVNF